jgi:hypothetical protein
MTRRLRRLEPLDPEAVHRGTRRMPTTSAVGGIRLNDNGTTLSDSVVRFTGIPKDASLGERFFEMNTRLGVDSLTV